jgi:cell division septation protein DedD
MVPSWRPAQRESDIPWLMLGAAGMILVLVALGGLGVWAWGSMGAGGVPVVEADPRPFKVRPDDPGGMRVPNQTEMVLERPSNRPQPPEAGRSTARMPEAPNLDGLRAATTPPPPAIPLRALVPVPAAEAPPAPAPEPVPAPMIATPRPAPTPAPAPAPVGGRVQVQLGAMSTEEAARGEWVRLQGRVPDLQGRSPQILRFERPGQPPLFRLRTGGFADQDAARQLCETVRARGGNCMLLRG